MDAIDGRGMRSARVVAVALCGLLCSPLALGTAAADSATLDAMRFLVGACWSAPFPGGDKIDTHCYTPVYDGVFIRDRHVVRGGGASTYCGETIYHVDPKADAISYRYWNSLGGVSDGTLVPTDAGLVSPAELHVREDGSKIEIRSVITRVGDDRYVSVAEEKDDGGWRALWRMEFVKRPCTKADDPAACARTAR